MLRHHISHELRPQTTAHLAQTMAFLQLNTTELENTLMNELNQNPALELVDSLTILNRDPITEHRPAQLPLW